MRSFLINVDRDATRLACVRDAFAQIGLGYEAVAVVEDMAMKLPNGLAWNFHPLSLK